MAPDLNHAEIGAARPLRLEMRHISKSFGGVRALRDVSIFAGPGEVVALCGENGAGKSTLMKILAGAISDYEGEIVLSGKAVTILGTPASRGRGDPDHLSRAQPRSAIVGRRKRFPWSRADLGRDAGVARRSSDGEPDRAIV